MKNTKNKFSVSILVLAVLLATGSLVVQQSLAQGGGGAGSGGGSGDQSQDRDQIQDPVTHDGDEPLQDRDQDKLQDQVKLQDQDRDQIQDPVTHDGDEPIQDRDQLRDPSLRIGDLATQDLDQLRDRLRDQIEEPDQDRDRDHIRANDSDGLQEVIVASKEVSDDIVNGLEEDVRELARNRNRVDVGVMALIAAQNMIGQSGGQIPEVAKQIHATHQVMLEKEEQIQDRGRIAHFFFGGDSESVASMQVHMQQNQERIQQIKQYLNDCDCEEKVRTMLQEQVQSIEDEHVRLQKLAAEENESRGLFGVLFGWL